MGDVRQGGNSYFAIALQPDSETLVTDPTDFWRVRRQFVSYGLEADTVFLQSDAVRGGIDHVKGQPGRKSGDGPIDTELYIRHMTPYVQAVLNADPATPSVDIAETTVYNGEVTPTGVADGTTVITVGAAGEGKDIEVTQPTSPGRLLITLANGEGEIKVEGRRKTGLGSYDMESISETKTLDENGSALFDAYAYHRIDQITLPNTGQTLDTATDLDIVAKPRRKSTRFTPRRGIFDGWSLYQVIGGVPGLGWSVVPRTMSFDFTNMRITMETLARFIREERTPEGGAFMKKLVDDSDLANDEFIPNTFFAGIGAYFRINDEFTIVRGFTLSIDQALDFDEGSTGSPHPAHPDRGDRTREFTATFRVDYEAAAEAAAEADVVNWTRIYDNNETVKLEASAYYWTQDGEEFYHKITITEFQLTEQPSKPVNNRGKIEVSLTGRAVVENAPDIISWEVVDVDGWINSLDDATLGITFSDDAPGAGDEVIATITGDRRITGLALDSLTVADSASGTPSLGDAVTKVSDTEYTVPVTMPASGTGTVTLKVAADGVGQGNAETTGTVNYS